jgi:DNA polymerase-3 subunit epsilon
MVELLNFGGRNKKLPHASSTLIDDVSFVVLDTELTGLNERKDSIVSVGAVRMAGRKISLGDRFYRLVKPRAELTSKSVIVHGITPSEVAGEAESAHVLAEFASFCGESVLVGHCVSIDMAFLDREMKQTMNNRLDNPLIDTADVFFWMRNRGLMENMMVPRLPELYKLARSFDIRVADAHHAQMDSFITAQLFQRFLVLLKQEGISTLQDLLRIADPRSGSSRFRTTGEIGSL